MLKKIISVLIIVLLLLIFFYLIFFLKNSNDEDVKSVNNLQIKLNHSFFKPKPKISWQIQLSGQIDTSYDVELYDVDLVETPQEIIDELHRRKIKVICYFSAGTWENYREDSKFFDAKSIGRELKEWNDENWLDISKYSLFEDIMKRRFDLALQKKCDGVDVDNVDGYLNPTGFDIDYNDQLKYNIWLSAQAHKRNLSISLKNDLLQINDLVDYFDFVINEQCFYYNECDLLLPFIRKGKAVLGMEYELETNVFCNKSKEMNFSWIKKNLELDEMRISC